MVEEAKKLGRAGSKHYKTYVGPPSRWDFQAMLQFNVLTGLGMTGNHYVLDVGCGSLRAGRLMIPYLRPGHYFGIEPNRWLVHEGLRHELGCDIIRAKAPMFSDESGFDLSVFARHKKKFDYIIAQSIFSHTPKRDMAACITSAAKVMHWSSVFVFDYVLEKTNYQGEAWVYPQNVGYTRAYVRHLCERTHLRYEEIEVALVPKRMVWVAATLEWFGKDGLEEEDEELGTSTDQGA